MISWKAALITLSVLVATASASECQIDAAKAYVKAIASHSKQDAAAVPLEDDVVRYEGPPGLLIQSANGAKDLRQSLVSGPSAFTVYKAERESYSTLNATAVKADYTIRAGLLDGLVPLTTARIEEWFTFKQPEDCDIQRIDAVFHIGQKRSL